MPCSHIKLPDGTVAIVKHAKARNPRCKFCPARLARVGRANDGSLESAATLLCDFEVGRTLGGDPITCDAPVCVHCAKRVGPDKDFCPKHQGGKEG
jgi:hypothetical protein